MLFLGRNMKLFELQGIDVGDGGQGGGHLPPSPIPTKSQDSGKAQAARLVDIPSSSRKMRKKSEL